MLLKGEKAKIMRKRSENKQKISIKVKIKDEIYKIYNKKLI